VGHTISVGVAVHAHGVTGRATLLRADRALYDAKRAGRDTARIAD
jgi:GGDEF domain-containing protein